MPKYTEYKDGVTKTYSEEEWNSRHSGVIALGIVVLVLAGAAVLFVNIFRINAIRDFGLSLYGNNLIHFHVNSYMKIKKKVFIFSERTAVANALNGKDAFGEAGSGQVLIHRGYISSSDSKWVAVEGYSNQKRVVGWIWGANQEKPWEDVSDSSAEYDISPISKEIRRGKMDAEHIEIIKINAGNDLETARDDAEFAEKYVSLSKIFDNSNGMQEFVLKSSADRLKAINVESVIEAERRYISGIRLFEGSEKYSKSEEPPNTLLNAPSAEVKDAGAESEPGIKIDEAQIQSLPDAASAVETPMTKDERIFLHLSTAMSNASTSEELNKLLDEAIIEFSYFPEDVSAQKMKALKIIFKRKEGELISGQSPKQ